MVSQGKFESAKLRNSTMGNSFKKSVLGAKVPRPEVRRKGQERNFLSSYERVDLGQRRRDLWLKGKDEEKDICLYLPTRAPELKNHIQYE
eukprot:scaffold37993_cov22-Tisochrysis_lutea.AAC.1